MSFPRRPLSNLTEIFKRMSIITIFLLSDNEKESQESSSMSGEKTLRPSGVESASIEKFDRTENHLSAASVSDSN